MRFQAYFTPLIKILLYIMAVISFVGLIIGILAFAGVHIELTLGQATSLVSMCPICTIAALLFATLHYKVDATNLRLYFGFIDILGGRIRIDKILNIVIDDNIMYISYLYKGMDPIIAAIVISPKRYREMTELLMSRNPKIVFSEKKDESSDSQQ